MLPLALLSPEEIRVGIAQRAKNERLKKNWTRDECATRSGVSHSSLRRFEIEGKISLENLVLLALALGCEESFSKLFDKEEVPSIAELKKGTRQRAYRGRKGGKSAK